MKKITLIILSCLLISGCASILESIPYKSITQTYNCVDDCRSDHADGIFAAWVEIIPTEKSQFWLFYGKDSRSYPYTLTIKIRTAESKYKDMKINEVSMSLNDGDIVKGGSFSSFPVIGKFESIDSTGYRYCLFEFPLGKNLTFKNDQKVTVKLIVEFPEKGTQTLIRKYLGFEKIEKNTLAHYQ